MRSEWGFAGGCAALDLLLNSRRRGSTGLRGAWTCPAHFGAAVLLLLCAPAYAGDVSESNPGASGQAGGVKNFPTARDVALMEMFTQNGGSLNGVVYSLKEPGDDALLSAEAASHFKKTLEIFQLDVQIGLDESVVQLRLA